MSIVTQPTAQLISRAGVAATLQSVQITGQLDGLALRLSTRQHYINTSADNLEAVYTFPLPWGATLLGLNAEIDGHRLQGTVLERKQATQRYEAAIDDGDTPVMVERSDSGLYTANLGNLKPGESAVIEIDYAELLRFEQGQIRITVPTTVAPRYGDAHQRGGLATHESVDASLLVQYPLTVSIRLHGDMAQAAVQSPSHPIALARQADALVVSLTQGGFLDRDFVLLLQGLSGQSFATAAPDGDGVALLASFCPVLPVLPQEPLLLKVLVDCSGSMDGDSISAARRALHEVLKELGPQDWLSYSRFGNDVVHDLPGLLPCQSANIKKVADCIAQTEADLGGTEMNRALLSTFKLPPPVGLNAVCPPVVSGQGRGLAAPQFPQNVLLITDGDIWDVAGVIASAQTSGHRVFAIGVGSAPGESLLREMAEQTGGACELVSPHQSVAEVIIRMFRRLRSPRCADLHVDWGTPVQWQSALPLALYGGDTLHLCASAASAPVSMPVPVPVPVLSWVANGVAMQAAASQLQSTGSALLPRLVAAQHIAALVQPTHRGQRVPSGDKAKLKAAQAAEALALALRYQLVTDQTNLILVHVRAQADKAEGLPVLAQITHMQAAGWGGAGSVRQDMFSPAPLMSACAPPHDFLAFSSVAPCAAASFTVASRFDQFDADLDFGAGDAELPVAFLYKGTGASSEPAPTVNAAPPMPRRIRWAQQTKPIITPLALLQGFEVDAAVQKTMVENRLVQLLEALSLPSALAPVLDDLAQTLGADAKAWAVFIQWLADHLADQFSLSRQTERLLRHWLKHADAATVADLKQQLAARFGAVQAGDWGI